MNKLSKSLIVLFLAFLLGSCFGIDFVQAQNNETNLKIIKECNIQYVGESCVVELKLFNNTGKILDGTAILHIDYQGICGDGPFDGEGIKVWYNDSLSDSDWNNGEITFSGFNIAKGETQPKLKIETASNLCPGGYTFIFSLKGTFEEEEYITPPVAAGGVAYIPPKPTTIITGDINGDGKVDKYDFALMMANWGKIGANTSDLNNDGKVNKYDFAILMANWTIA